MIYAPLTERQSHYFEARLGAQFDAVIHVDRSTAVEALDAREEPAEEVAEAYPGGL